ncbi:MAG TPA: HesA/MoeB/ThiF family protein [Candidatus Binatia bacterium]|nr:HesA/MoeB/ThiF family protein [Candidatus Binatia bacterium]
MSEDLSRYARHVALREVGVHGQQLLRDSAVLVCGLGGLGCASAQYLCAAGVGRLDLADHDRVDRSNLARQVLYGAGDVGQPKAPVAAARLSALNADVAVQAHALRLDAATLPPLVSRADVVLDCTDNFDARFAINAACVAARKPLVSGAAIRFGGQLAVLDARAGGACYACLFPQAGERQERCEEAGILGPVAGTIGALQALAALKLLLGRSEDVGRLQLWDALAMSWRSVRIERDPGCPVCNRAAA